MEKKALAGAAVIFGWGGIVLAEYIKLPSENKQLAHLIFVGLSIGMGILVIKALSESNRWGGM